MMPNKPNDNCTDGCLGCQVWQVFRFASIRNVLVPDMKGAMQDILDTSHYVCQNIYG